MSYERLCYSSFEQITYPYCRTTYNDIGYKDNYRKIDESTFDIECLFAPVINNIYDEDDKPIISRTMLSLYRTGKRSPKKFASYYMADDVKAPLHCSFMRFITNNLSTNDKKRLITEISNIINYEGSNGTMLEVRQKHLLSLARPESIESFLIHCFVYAMKREAKNFDEWDDSEFKEISFSILHEIKGAKPSRYGVYNAPYDPGDCCLNIDNDLLKLWRSFRGNRQRIFICGEEGVGKTELALRYARDEALNKQQIVIWIDATDESRIIRSIRTFLIENQLDTFAEDKDSRTDEGVRQSFLQWLKDTPGWLLIFDNATVASDGNGIYDGFLPKKHDGKVVVTTSNELERRLSKILLKERSNKEVYDYLQDRYEDKYRISILNLSDIITFKNLPFALELASGYSILTGDFDLFALDSYLPILKEGIIDSKTYGKMPFIRRENTNNKLEGFSNLEVIQAAFMMIWDRLAQEERLLLRLVAETPYGEITTNTFEQLLYRDNDGIFEDFTTHYCRDFKRRLMNPEKFVDLTNDLAKVGVIKVLSYAKDDERINGHFGDISKIRVHSLIREFIREDKDLDGIPRRLYETFINAIRKNMA